jgi:hypothetical protein
MAVSFKWLHNLAPNCTKALAGFEQLANFGTRYGPAFFIRNSFNVHKFPISTTLLE